MHIGETASNGMTTIYGVDNYSRGIAYSRAVAQMWAAAPDFVAALQYILQLCGTEKESEFHHTLKVDIPEVCEAALRLVESPQERVSSPTTKLVDTIPSTNSALWRCESCGYDWASPSKLPCSNCSGAGRGDASDTPSAP